LFLPELPRPLSVLLKFLTAFLICLVTFGKKRIFQNCFCFFGVSFLLAGGLFAVSLCSPEHSAHRNGCYYFNISLTCLAGFTVLAYGLLSVIQFFYDRNQIAEHSYQVKISYHQQAVILDGLADTGNSLADFYTGKPVIICDASKLDKLARPEHSHILPYLTVAGSGTLEVFQPDEIIISSETGTSKSVDALIGIGMQENGKAIFNPKLIRF
jgi:stage II sporulation protein GA (sporulation sigma-E factor processing peptidase)